MVIWAAKFSYDQAKARRLGMGAFLPAKKDTEESLIDSLTYPAKGRTIDSQVDDQTWLALDAVFDRLNYTNRTLGRMLYPKMRLLEFQPRDQPHDLEAFFEEHLICTQVQVIFNQLGRRITWRPGIVANPGKHCGFAPLSSSLPSIVCLFLL